MIDLPWRADPIDMNVENNLLVVTSKQPAVAYVQSIESAAPLEGAPSILVAKTFTWPNPIPMKRVTARSKTSRC